MSNLSFIEVNRHLNYLDLNIPTVRTETINIEPNTILSCNFRSKDRYKTFTHF